MEVLVDGLFPFGEAEPAEGVVAATYFCISISPSFECCILNLDIGVGLSVFGSLGMDVKGEENVQVI